MADDQGGTYNTGLLSVVNGSDTVNIPGALLTTQAIRGDHIFVNGMLLFVEAVVDDETITIDPPYTGTTLSDVPYVLEKMSWSRWNAAITQQKVRELLAYYKGVGLFYFVSGDAPDPGLGEEGQFALKANTGVWKLWYRTGGAWVLQGSPTNIEVMGAYDPDAAYAIGDVVSWMGQLWKSLVASNTGHQPDLSPSQWLLIFSGGDRYDIQFFDTDRPASGELISKSYPTGVTFPVGLTTSHAEAEAASTGDVFYSFQKNGVEFARLTFNSGNTVGVWSCPTETTFGSGDKFSMLAPAVRDPTLSGVGGVLIGYRNVGV